ncbi:ATP synthase F1 subunit epsilon [Hugenholtzia roseola]|uniref:ATP synthase F1 subunit epsilon n=1 Tax=Hugenholtzia roseola TaxID=1002 RepID=UPI000413AB21|nr:ATP synthase F1 subunit epsilon [Hugenholtzia roseola]
MQVEVITPDDKVFTGTAQGVKVPGSKGSFEVLQGHSALVSSLEKGKVRIRNGNQDIFVQIDGGVIEVQNNQVVILAEKATVA